MVRTFQGLWCNLSGAVSVCQRIVGYVMLALGAAALLHAAFYLGQVLILEGRGGVGSDGFLFEIVGRGLLNGLRPYADLFESKPPGMFFLFALSLVVSGDDRTALLFQVAIFIAIPVMLAAFAWQQGQRHGTKAKPYEITVVALILGILLSLYLEEQSGSFVTESFGSFFACLYFLHVFMRRDAGTKGATLVNACLLLATIGMKEPFVLSLLGGMLLLARDRKHFLRAFLMPLAIAVTAGGVILVVLGYAGPYLSVYLPTMLGDRLVTDVVEPLWLRGFAVGRLLGNFTQSYPIPLLSVTVALLWLLVPAFMAHLRAPRDFLLMLAGSAVAYVVLLNTRVIVEFLMLVMRLGINPAHAGGFIALQVGKYLLLVLLLTALLVYQYHRGFLSGTMRACIVLYLTTVTVGLAEYTGHHFAFGFPLVFALALVFIAYAAQESSWSVPTATIALACIGAGMIYQPNPDHLRSLVQMIEFRRSIPGRELATRFDRLLDRCHITAYFGHSTHYYLALTRHSPLGPVFALAEHRNYLPPDHPLLERTYANIREKAQLVVLVSGSTLGDIQPGLDAIFTPDAPPCAADTLPLGNLELFFRSP